MSRDNHTPSPCLSHELEEALKALSANPQYVGEQDDYYRFIDKFGTHVIMSIKMGSKFVN